MKNKTQDIKSTRRARNQSKGNKKKKNDMREVFQIDTTFSKTFPVLTEDVWLAANLQYCILPSAILPKIASHFWDEKWPIKQALLRIFISFKTCFNVLMRKGFCFYYFGLAKPGSSYSNLLYKSLAAQQKKSTSFYVCTDQSFYETFWHRKVSIQRGQTVMTAFALGA